MNFIPFHDKVVIKPLEKKSIIQTDDKRLHERGEVLVVGDDILWLKVGDVVYFDSWGCSKTAPDDEGNEYYIVRYSSETIYGKEQRMQDTGMAT